MAQAIVGVIGGSGLYDLPGLEDLREETITSPWGSPSDAVRMGRLGRTQVAFLPRHGRGHHLSPGEINYRANIDVLKRIGVTDLISVSACGSYKDELYPGALILIDQLIDRTTGRASSFFGNGCVVHVSLAQPVSPLLTNHLSAAAEQEAIPLKKGGVYVCMEGPQFSTYAESMSYKNAGCDVIGMTAATEAKLAREAEISYALIAMVTDYDCWRPSEAAVDVRSILEIARANTEKTNRLLARMIRDFPAEHEPCPIGSDRALDGAIITAPDARDPALLTKLDAILARLNAKK